MALTSAAAITNLDVDVDRVACVAAQLHSHQEFLHRALEVEGTKHGAKGVVWSNLKYIRWQSTNNCDSIAGDFRGDAKGGDSSAHTRGLQQ